MSSQSNRAFQNMHKRYERALHLVKGVFTDDITYNDMVFPQWIGESDCFWYERVTDSDGSSARGAQYRLVDARAGTNIEAFDHARLAKSLSKAAGVEVNPDKLPLQDLRMEVCSEDNHSRTVKTVTFRAHDQRWSYDVETGYCSSVQSCPVEWVVSPDGKTAVFVKDNNLWLHDIQSGKERALTFDGERHYRYGFAGNGWAEPFHLFVQARWSSDSKRIFTVQHDERKVESLPVTHYVPNEGVRPVVKNYKLALPGDAHVATFRLLSIEVETGRIQDANYRAIPDTRNGRGLFEAGLGWWSPDNRHAYFIDVERDYKTVRLVAFDTDNGETRTVFKETTDTQVNLMAYGDDYPALTPLLTTKELLWYSERSGWAHLYLYDL